MITTMYNTEMYHSAKGSHWQKKNHKYLRIENGRYIYPDGSSSKVGYAGTVGTGGKKRTTYDIYNGNGNTMYKARYLSSTGYNLVGKNDSSNTRNVVNTKRWFDRTYTSGTKSGGSGKDVNQNTHGGIDKIKYRTVHEYGRLSVARANLNYKVSQLKAQESEKLSKGYTKAVHILSGAKKKTGKEKYRNDELDMGAWYVRYSARKKTDPHGHERYTDSWKKKVKSSSSGKIVKNNGSPITITRASGKGALIHYPNSKKKVSTTNSKKSGKQTATYRNWYKTSAKNVTGKTIKVSRNTWDR